MVTDFRKICNLDYLTVIFVARNVLKPKGSLPCSQQTTTGPYLQPNISSSPLQVISLRSIYLLSLNILLSTLWRSSILNVKLTFIIGLIFWPTITLDLGLDLSYISDFI
jgi:hypothetical protein